DIIPDGFYVVIRSFNLDPVRFPSHPQAGPAQWISDTSLYGSGNSLYHNLIEAGFSSVDSMFFPRQFILAYKKGDQQYAPSFILSQGTYDNISLDVNMETPSNHGKIFSPIFGPAKSWKQMLWEGDYS